MRRSSMLSHREHAPQLEQDDFVMSNHSISQSTSLLFPTSDEEILAIAQAKVDLSNGAALSEHSAQAHIKRILEIFGQKLPVKEVPAHQTGDYAIVLHSLSPDEQHQFCKRVLEEIREIPFVSVIESAERVGPFLNLTLRAETVLQDFEAYLALSPEQLGTNTSLQGKKYLVDYSSPNIGKSLHVGHLGTTLVGQVLSNILEANTATVFRVNHLGDWGTPLGMLKVAFERWGDTPAMHALSDTPSKYYSTLYQRFHEVAKEDEHLRELAKKEFQKLEQGDSESRSFGKGFGANL